MVDAGTDEADPFFRLARAVAGAASAWHRVQVVGLSHLPDGPALLVGNHGLFGLETPLFFHAVYRATGRVPVGLADRNVFGAPPIRWLLSRVGGVPGTQQNALKLLAAGRCVVCYPGGSREVFKPPHRHGRLRWERALGFAQVAIAAKVPVLPFAGLGVDDTFLNFGHLDSVRKLLGRYAVPLAVGLGPIPFPVPIRFVIGAPMMPPAELHQARAFKSRVQCAVERLLEGHAGVLETGTAAAVP